MVHGEMVLIESTAIMEYVVEAFPGPSLRPMAPDERWRMALEDPSPGELLEDDRRKAAIGVRKVENSLSKSNWLAGSAYPLAEIDAYSLMDPLRDGAPALLDGAASTGSSCGGSVCDPPQRRRSAPERRDGRDKPIRRDMNTAAGVIKPR